MAASSLLKTMGALRHCQTGNSRFSLSDSVKRTLDCNKRWGVLKGLFLGATVFGASVLGWKVHKAPLQKTKHIDAMLKEGSKPDLTKSETDVDRTSVVKSIVNIWWALCIRARTRTRTNSASYDDSTMPRQAQKSSCGLTSSK